MITVVLLVQVKSGREKDFEEKIAKLFAIVEADEPGCKGLHWGPTETAGQYAMVERYADREALEAHNSSAHVREYGPAIAALFSGEPLLIRFTEA